MKNKKIKEVDIDGDRVYLRKDFLGWRVINPDKRVIGGWRNLIFVLLLLAIVLTFFVAYYELSFQCNDMIENPCNYSYFEGISCPSKTTGITEWPIRALEK